MVMRRQCFLEGLHASEPRVLGGPAGAAGQEGEGGGGDGLMWRLGLGRCGLGGENT